jgi:hypothetical protein
VRTPAGARRPLATAVLFHIPLIGRIGREFDPVADHGAQETAITERGILFRTTEDEPVRDRDFTEVQRD